MWPAPPGWFICTIVSLIVATFNLSSIYDKYLFHPSHKIGEAPSIAEIQCRTTTFTVADETLSCWFYKKEQDKGLILVSHGNGGNMTHVVRLAERLLKDTDRSVLLYDYEGYGKSDGEASVAAILRDGVGAFDYAVKDLGYSPDQIIIYGESLGCAVTCHIAAERKPEAIILQSGFRSLPTIARDTYSPLKLMPGFAFPEPRLDNEKIVHGIHPPLLIMHGKKDKIIPFRHGEELYREASQPKTFVEFANSGHNDIRTADGDLYDRTITDFVGSLKNTVAHTQTSGQSHD